MITEKENIADVFHAFHDGTILFENELNSNQTWKIECAYLAEMIDPEYSQFWIKIYKCHFLQFDPWLNPIELPKKLWTKTEEIFITGLVIYSAEEIDNKVLIFCNQDDDDFNFSGGELRLDCDGIEVYDESWNKIEFDKLIEICNQYWNKLV